MGILQSLWMPLTHRHEEAQIEHAEIIKIPHHPLIIKPFLWYYKVTDVKILSHLWSYLNLK
jgi:hypothetical protein